MEEKSPITSIKDATTKKRVSIILVDVPRIFKLNNEGEILKLLES